MGKRKFLSDPQKMQLEYDGILAHPDQYTSAFLRRVKAIQAILDGKPTDEVAKELDVSRGSIDNWFQTANRFGVQALPEVERAGQPPKLDEDHLEELAQVITMNPAVFGYRRWSSAAVADYSFRAFGIQISRKTGQRVLSKLRKAARAVEDASREPVPVS